MQNPSLLRVQFTKRCFRLECSREQVTHQPRNFESPDLLSSLADQQWLSKTTPGIHPESADGLTDFI